MSLLLFQRFRTYNGNYHSCQIPEIWSVRIVLNNIKVKLFSIPQHKDVLESLTESEILSFEFSCYLNIILS